MRTIVAILTILLIPIAFSRLPVNTVQAQSFGSGSFTGTSIQTGSTTAANGTEIYHYTDKASLTGVFSGTSVTAETDLVSPSGGGTFHNVETFTGSFNGSKQGTITFLDIGRFDTYGDFSEKDTFSGGTGGLAGLQGTVSARGVSAGSTFSGSYTVISATWGNAKPVPEFSTLALPIILGSAFSICFTMLRRKKAN